MIKTKIQAIAEHLQMDTADLKDYRYHYGHTSIPVFALTSGYYCATKGSEKPAKYKGYKWEDWLAWKEVKDDYVNRQGWKIWKAETE